MNTAAIGFLFLLCGCAHSYVPYVPPPLTQEQVDSQAKWEAKEKKQQDDWQADMDFRQAKNICLDYKDKYEGCDVIEAHQKKLDDYARKKWDEENQASILQEKKKIRDEATKLENSP